MSKILSREMIIHYVVYNIDEYGNLDYMMTFRNERLARRFVKEAMELDISISKYNNYLIMAKGMAIAKVIQKGEFMSDVITALTTGLTADKFFEVVADLMPFVIVIVPVALGLYFLRKLIKGAGKGKVRF